MYLKKETLKLGYNKDLPEEILLNATVGENITYIVAYQQRDSTADVTKDQNQDQDMVFSQSDFLG